MDKLKVEWELTAKQAEAWDILLNSYTYELLFGGGAGGGKTVFGCGFSIYMALTYKEVRGFMGRNSLEDFKKSTMLTFYDVLNRFGMKEGRDWVQNQQEKYFYFNQSGSYIYYNELSYYPSDPDYNYLGSTEYTWAFIDEANQIQQKAKSIIRSRIRYKLAENGLIPKVLLCCNPDNGYLKTEFFTPHKKGQLSPERAFIQALAVDNHFIDPTYIKNLQGLDPVMKERLLFGNWDYNDDPARLMDIDSINDLFTNIVIPTNDKYITADIARLGGDKIVFGYWEGFALKEIVHFSKMQLFSPFDKPDEPSVYNRLVEFRTKYQVSISHILVDEDGMGGGIKDRLGCKGFVNNSKALNGENYTNLKTQCYYKMSKKINERGVSVIVTEPQVRDWIIEELQQVRGKDYDKDKKLAIVSKDEVKEHIGRSPDFSDMIAMRYWFELIPKPSIRVIRM